MSTATQNQTPFSKWASLGEPDPHEGKYDCDLKSLANGYKVVWKY